MSQRVLLMEDDALTQISLASALRAEGFDVVAHVANVSEAIPVIAESDVDIAILDIDVGQGPTGLDLADMLQRRSPLTGIVILTSSTDPRLVRASLPPVPSHAVYLVKGAVTDISILVSAIHHAHDLAHGAADAEELNKANELTLTDVQMDTLRLVAQGLSNSEIARQRFVSEKAVEYTISKIAQALDIQQTSTINQRVHIARMYFRLRGQG